MDVEAWVPLLILGHFNVTGTAADPVTVAAEETAVCDIMHKARPSRGLSPFQVSLLILDSRLAPTTSNLTGGPSHRSEKRINLSHDMIVPSSHMLSLSQEGSVPNGYIALGYFLFLKEQIKDVIIA